MNNETLSVERFDAGIFDLDGVVTRTAEVHAAAWKSMFDGYLAARADTDGHHQPFDIETDYAEHVDGKPRYEGVRDFLRARGIELPYGDPDDSPDEETVCGLGNRKNRLFVERLRTDGVEIYESSVVFIRALRRVGMKIAVVSSSRNCREVLQAAGIEALFDARVDGEELRRLGLAGKPEPDMFLEAARRLESTPERSLGVEDAIVGVRAAKAAGFGCVIGVSRGTHAEALRAGGADIVVDDLGSLQMDTGHEAGASGAEELPSALDHVDEIVPGDKDAAAVFLDYDGTLTPIVADPDAAVLSHSMRDTLRRLAGLCRVAVLSGRDLADVRRRVGLEDMWYAGSHGFDIAGPGVDGKQHQQGNDYRPALDAAEESLRSELAGVDGCLVERKRFSIATHYRNVAGKDVPVVQRAVEHARAAHRELRLTRGKKVFELQPDIDWGKGRALHWVMRALSLDPARAAPVYIGDDETDEDAFREVAGYGVGILVAADELRPTRASYRLDDPAAVGEFLSRFADLLEKGRS